MNQRYLKLKALPVLMVAVIVVACFQEVGVGVSQGLSGAGVAEPFVPWQSQAKLHKLISSERGELIIGAGGIEFQVPNHEAQRWVYQEIQTFRLSRNGLVIETYQNRKLHIPGVARYRFDLEHAFPPAIAAELAKEVQRPSQNAVPNMASQNTGCTAIPAHHHALKGGTNGVLNFCDEGIDYVSSTLKDSRNWRWADLQTLSDPDPYHLLIFGYRDTYSFDLKGAISRSLFYRLVDALDAYNSGSGRAPNIQSPDVARHRHGGKDE